MLDKAKNTEYKELPNIEEIEQEMNSDNIVDGDNDN